MSAQPPGLKRSLFIRPKVAAVCRANVAQSRCGRVKRQPPTALRPPGRLSARPTGSAETGTMHVCGLRGAPGGAEGLCSKTWNSLRQFPRCVELCSHGVELCTFCVEICTTFISCSSLREKCLSWQPPGCTLRPGGWMDLNVRYFDLCSTWWLASALALCM